MNAIIVGKNGLQSVLGAVALINDVDIVVFKKHATKEFWTRFENGKSAVKGIEKPSFGTDDKVLKWGNSIPVSIQNNDLYYNKGFAINNASNKLESRLLFAEHDVPAPYTFVEEQHIKSFPCIIRPIKHRAGKYFYIANSAQEFRSIVSSKESLADGYYASEFFPKTREFRLHCAFGKVLIIKEKPAPENHNVIAWNFAVNEESWITIDRGDYDLGMCVTALNAMDALSLDIGAVDIMSYPTDASMPNHVVCEINTSPSLTPYLQEKYSMLFRKIFKSNQRIEKWNFHNFVKGSSLCWKNFQLTT